MKTSNFFSFLVLLSIVISFNLYTRVSECQRFTVSDITLGVDDEMMKPKQSNLKAQEPSENIEPYSSVSKFADPSRYEEVKAPLDRALDEATFWGRQMSEHQLFLQLGFEEAALKNRAKQLHEEWENHRNMLKEDPSIETLNEWLPLLKKTRDFQIKALEMVNNGKWIGWIFPLFINHITLELDLLVDKLNDIHYSVKDEIIFWNRINSEHAAFAAHLLDPSERELFLKADELSQKLHKLQLPKSEKEMWLKLSLNAGKELDKFNKSARSGAKANQLLSVIHPVLLDHVIREGERGIQTLEKLKSQSPEDFSMIDATQNTIREQNERILD